MTPEIAVFCMKARGACPLVSALAMVIGWEALVVQRDVRGLSPAAGEELSVWAARALLRVTLEEARESQKTRKKVTNRRTV
jgi:hypothetical protein